ncbi:hypothetical protein CYMTET_8432, partial [Cymbomonas tetramitiformis]
MYSTCAACWSIFIISTTIVVQGVQGRVSDPDIPNHLRDLLQSDTAQCSQNSACAGLAGNCCPTDDGVYLQCCDASFFPSSSPAPPPSPVSPPGTPGPPSTVYFQQVGSGAYRYGTRPDGMGELGACDGSSGAPYLTGTAAGKPVPTNDWWSSLVFSRHSFPMYPHPLSLVASAGGLVVAFPQNSPAQEACCTPETYDYRTMDSVGSTNTGQYDLIIGLAGLDSPSTLVSDYTDWTVTAEWRRSEGGDGALWSTFGHGMPMIYSHTAQSEQIHITLNTWHCTFSHELANGGCLSLWYGAVANTADGTPGLSNPDADAEPGAVLGVTIRGVTPSDARPQWESHYALVAAPGCHWEQTTSASAHQVVVRVEAGCSVEAGGPGPEGGQAAVVALLTTASVTELELFAAAAEAFPQNTSVTWAYDAPSAQVSSHFQVSASRMWGGEGAEVTAEPLLALYRHQWRYLAEDTLGEETELVYAPTPRGEMRVRRGSSFSTRYTFRGMVPAWPLAQTEVSDAVYAEVDSEYQATFASGSAAASYWAPRASDTYWGGKDIGRITHLLHTAEQVGHVAAAERFLELLQERMEDWLDARTDDGDGIGFYYDATWHAFIGYKASYFSDSQMNDHEFHYAYFLLAAAAVAERVAGWGAESEWGGMLKLVVADVASAVRPADGAALTAAEGGAAPPLPFLRQLDPYAGHSWASGQGCFMEGNNLESSSEAMNFASGIFLFGAATGDEALRDLGIYYYATYAVAIEEYWFDVEGEVFETRWAARYRQTGILWSNGCKYGTWWTDNREEIHGVA